MQASCLADSELINSYLLSGNIDKKAADESIIIDLNHFKRYQVNHLPGVEYDPVTTSQGIRDQNISVAIASHR